MPKKMSRFVLTEQPINWNKSILCGMLSATFMMAFIDVFYLMNLTSFSFELYLGSLLRGTQFGDQNWTVGFIANLVMGGVFGMLYAYFFEYVYYKSNSRTGIWIGLWHTLLAGLAFFPFFNALHEFIDTGLYPRFGFLGFSLGAQTPILIATGHFLFGACMGLFYGDVRAVRLRTRHFEPGEWGNQGDPDVITSELDPIDRVAV